MTFHFGPGTPRIQVLSGDFTTVVKTLYLPAPDKQGSELTWLRDAINQDLLPPQGKRQRLLGFYPRLTLSWSVYDDTTGHGRTIGQADGNFMSYTDFEAILSAAPRTLKIFPGPTGNGFRCLITKDPSPKLAGSNLARDVSVEFTGWDLYSTKVL